MKKGIIPPIVALLILLGTVSAGAQARFEFNLNWPLTIGINTSNSLFSGANFDLSQYHLLLPDFRIYYQWGGEGLLRGGVGARAYTVIIESLIYPEAFIELNLYPLELEASLGGYLFGLFGLSNNFKTLNLLLPDFNVGFQVLSWLRLAGGVLLFTPVGSNWSQDFVYMGYIGARFIILPEKPKEE